MRNGTRQGLPVQRVVLAILGSGTFALFALVFSGHQFKNLFSTADQRGARAFAQGSFDEAAAQFTDPTWRGLAHFRAGDFKAAALDFSARNDAIAAFNRGNAQVMLGKYESAMQSYDRALSERPEWEPATRNREIARLRYEAVNIDVEEGQGTDGKLSANEIVFDNSQGKGDTVEVQVGEGETLSEEETQALWLRRVQTQPADFLRAKFSYQQRQHERVADDK